MSERKIKLGTFEGAKEFVTVATKCDFNIDVYFNKMAFDAKSILGILSLDHRHELTVMYDGMNEGFSDILEKYAVAE